MNRDRDWHEMTVQTHRNAKGCCEWCGNMLPFGTPPAHIIPRDKNHPEYDDPWNLALLGFIPPCTCHTKLDTNRAKAYLAMKAQGAPLADRIDKHPILKEHFKKRVARQKYIERNKG